MGQVGGLAWVDDDGSVVTRLVQISNGSVEEERRVYGSMEEEIRDGEAVRREIRRKENESKKE